VLERRKSKFSIRTVQLFLPPHSPHPSVQIIQHQNSKTRAAENTDQLVN